MVCLVVYAVCHYVEDAFTNIMRYINLKKKYLSRKMFETKPEKIFKMKIHLFKRKCNIYFNF